MLHMDELEAYKIGQPENDETIAGIGVGYDPSEKIFDISFSDKYRCEQCSARYEVRYSFSPITNASYNSATLCEVINFRREQNNTNGIIHKPSNGYSQIWAALKVQEADNSQLIEGATVYFAVKDISDLPGIMDRANMPDRDTYDLGTVPVSGVGNVRRVDLVKTIDYTIFPLLKKLYFTDNAFGSGHVNEAYSKKIPFKGGIKPFTFEIVSGSLPDGLTLSSDGLLTGIPTQTGTYSFRIKINESSSFNQVIQQDFTLSIYEPENCTDGFDNDANSLVDCNDMGCYDHQSCSTLLVDFGFPHVFGSKDWQTLLKDTYTDVFEAGPDGMTNVVGENPSYNYQGVAGTAKTFSSGERILVFWYNNGTDRRK